MKIILEIIRYILLLILVVAIGIIFIGNLVLDTIFSHNYMVSKLEEVDYYEKIFNECKENFSNHIMQSGLDENVLENIITIDKIKEDTSYILENVYFGKKIVLNPDILKENLVNNIDEYLKKEGIDKNKITDESKKSINDFVNLISNEYIDTIKYVSYEITSTQINIYTNIINKLIFYSKILVLILVVCILVLNFRRFSKNISMLGMGMLFLGFLYIYGNNFILKNIDVENLFIFNQSFTDVAISVIKENLEIIVKDGIKFIVFGFLLIVCGNYIYLKKEKLFLPLDNKKV